VQGVSVNQVAPRYDVNVNLLLAWLHDPGFADKSASDVVLCLPKESVAGAGG
jgi:transposase-like protein